MFTQKHTKVAKTDLKLYQILNNPSKNSQRLNFFQSYKILPNLATLVRPPKLKDGEDEGENEGENEKLIIRKKEIDFENKNKKK